MTTMTTMTVGGVVVSHSIYHAREEWNLGVIHSWRPTRHDTFLGVGEWPLTTLAKGMETQTNFPSWPILDDNPIGPVIDVSQIHVPIGTIVSTWIGPWNALPPCRR